MKKIMTTILALILILSMTACGHSSSNSTTETTIPTETTTETTISFDADSLVKAYQNGSWDGEFISDEAHCASIEDGMLWIDCQSTGIIPDASEEYYGDVISSNSNGTWTTDDNLVSFWSKGVREKEFRVGNSEYPVQTYKVSSHIVAFGGNTLWIHNLNGDLVDMVEQVHNCHQTSRGVFLYSTFEHKNFVITDVEIAELDSYYVRFPRENFSLLEQNSNLVRNILNLYYETDWDGSCRVTANGNFIAIHYHGVIVNNKIVTQDPRVHYENNETSYWLNGNQLVKFKAGEIKTLDIPEGMSTELLWMTSYGVVLQVYNDGFYTIVVVYPDDTSKIISTKAVDANVAYDTLYYMEGDTVYALEWENPEATSEIFFEGAYGVSPYTDEAEGAIVPYHQANWLGYGSKFIFSPYGN